MTRLNFSARVHCRVNVGRNMTWRRSFSKSRRVRLVLAVADSYNTSLSPRTLYTPSPIIPVKVKALTAL